MKIKFLFFFAFIFCTSSISTAQNQVQPWRFGIGGGINSTRLSKGGIIFDARDEREINFVGNRKSFQGNMVVSYRINKNLRLAGNLGITQSQCLAYRETVDEQSFILLLDRRTITTYDTVSQEYLFVDFPIFLRIQLWSLENKELEGLKPFIDLGTSTKFPLVNKSTFRQNKIDDPEMGTTISQYTSGDLRNQLLAPYLGVGIYLGDHFTLSYHWKGVRGKADQGSDSSYYTTIKSLTLHYFI